jgi:ATP-dependent DNA helicase RecG
MTRDELLKRILDIEWDDFEVKQAKSELPKNTWETVSAFCNTSGGWIVLGVNQHGKEFDITGVDNAEKLEQDFFSALRSQKFNAILTAKAYKYEIDGKKVLAFFVPSSLQKPIYYNNPMNTFIRCGSGDQRATNSEISAMFREQSFGIHSELVIPETDIGLLNLESLRGYRHYLKTFDLLAVYADYDDYLFCKKIGITDEKGYLTYAGLLMFGKTEVIHRHVPTFWMDLVEIPGNTVQEAKTRYIYRIPEQENLWEYYHVMIKRLRLLVDTPFKMNAEGFAVDDDSQFMVLREALVNMLMHTDHFSPVHSCIRIYTNRIEFLNAGSFPVPVERLGKGMLSIPRNPTIAKLFRFAKLAENIGFGIDKLKSWEQLTGNDVTFHGGIESVCLTLGLIRHNEFEIENDQTGGQNKDIQENVTENVIENVTETINNDSDIIQDINIVVNDIQSNELPIKLPNKLHINLPNKNPTATQMKILRFIKKNPDITQNELAEMLKITEDGVKYHFKNMIQKGIIKRKGSKKTGQWIIIKQEG